MKKTMKEILLPMDVDDASEALFCCTPEHLEDLAVGHLLALGRIRSAGDVLSVQHGPAGIRLVLNRPLLPERRLDRRIGEASQLKSSFVTSLSEIQHLTEELSVGGQWYGTHRIVLSSPQGKVFREDVGRHNATDKAIGYAALEGWDFSSCILGATGRISAEIFMKALELRIPVLFTRKYPSDFSAHAAQRLGVAIVAFSDRPQPWVLGAAWRVR